MKNDPISERERRFAVAYFETTLEMGTDHGASLPSYRRAFPSADVSNKQATLLAHRLAQSKAVQDLVDDLRNQQSLRAAVPAEHVTQQLERIAYSNVLDYMRVDQTDGSATIDLRDVPFELMSAVHEVKVQESENPEGVYRRTTTLKLHNKLDALDKLARIHCQYHDPESLNLTASELLRIIQSMKRRMGIVIDEAEYSEGEPGAVAAERSDARALGAPAQPVASEGNGQGERSGGIRAGRAAKSEN
jgi:hypothetical protein